MAKQKREAAIDLVRDACDLLVPAQAIEVLPPGTARLSAFTGVIGSTIGLLQVLLRVDTCMLF